MWVGLGESFIVSASQASDSDLFTGRDGRTFFACNILSIKVIFVTISILPPSNFQNNRRGETTRFWAHTLGCRLCKEGQGFLSWPKQRTHSSVPTNVCQHSVPYPTLLPLLNEVVFLGVFMRVQVGTVIYYYLFTGSECIL